MKTTALLLSLLFAGCINVDVDLGAAGPNYVEKVIETADTDAKIAIIDVQGVLTSDQEESIFGSKESQVVALVEKLKRVEADPDVKAVVLRIDSPGGDVTTSDILYHELVRFKQRRKIPVVAAFMGVAASGGYYLAGGADSIVAHPTTITGSIGVISMHVSLAGLMEKIGVKVEALKSGPRKDIGSPFRELGEDDRKILQALIDQFYARFVEVVVAGRTGGLTAAALKALADGRVYTARQALETKLVDRIGYLEDAINEAMTRAQIRRANLVMYSRRPNRVKNEYSAAAATPALPGSELDQARKLLGFHCYYLWEPYLLGK
jgi:protease-4